MNIAFSKMQGLGNDFMVIDAINQKVQFGAHKVRAWADRHFGIGFDQLLVVETSECADFKYRIFNADGSEVQQCGNGARCFARFVYDKGLTDKTEIQVETASGLIVLYLQADGRVKVNMGAPNFTPVALPFIADALADTYAVAVDNQSVELRVVSMGNPHAVLCVDDLANFPVASLGQALESHPRFPERVNVGFAEILNRQQIALRVYERGAAETLACGTGACAAMTVLKKAGLVDETVDVALPGGHLSISWTGQPQDSVWMVGPAVTVFEGVIVDED